MKFKKKYINLLKDVKITNFEKKTKKYIKNTKKNFLTSLF